MNIDATCQNEVNKETQQNNAVATSFHNEAYDPQAIAFYPGTFNNGYVPGADVIAQEGLIVANMLDAGNFQFAAARLQNDLIQLRPNRYAQNLLLTDVNLYDRKGVGSDLNLGYFNPYTQAFTSGYITPSVYRPFPTYPLSY